MLTPIARAGAESAPLAQAQRDLLTVLDHLRLGICVTNHAGDVTFASDAMETLTGHTPAALIGRPWHARLPLSLEGRRQIEAMMARPQAERSRLLLRLEPTPRRQYWTQADVRDDPYDRTRRFLYFHDVTEVHRARRILDGPARFRGMVGDSTVMRALYREIVEVAVREATVVVLGETGTGKELAARAIHDLSARHAHPFVPVNCAGLTESLLTSHLFGHRRGAFTGAIADQIGVFEAAHKGTLFLDEIGDISPAAQSALLRVLQEKEVVRIGESRPRKVDVRVIAATNRDLQAEVSAGRFRQDLFYRLWGTRLRLPPLRERRDDVPRLVADLLDQARVAGRTSVRDVSRDAMKILSTYAWPGNVRELQAVVEFACTHARTAFVIDVADLPPELTAPGADRLVIRDTLLEPKNPEHIRMALERTKGNRAEAARLLGIGRATLYRRLHDLRLDPSTDR